MQARSIVFALTLLCASPAIAEDEIDIDYNINGFSPTTLRVPVNQPFTLEVENDSTDTIEFYLHAQEIELGIPAGEEREVSVQPLAAGEYMFENALDSSKKGVLIAE